MEVISVENWEECQLKFKELSNRRSQLREDKTRIGVSNLLYRGQSNAQWRLATTLERYVGPLTSLEDYYRKICIAKSQIETFTKTKWYISSFSSYSKWLKSADFFKGTIPAYEYMAYLRHHGFPSPLLDWTNSPFIAAYFAFHNISEGIKNVSVYAYLEYAGKGKSHAGMDPLISSLGPNIKTHDRHFLQQCEYTICTLSDGENHYYACHENVFSENEEEQDLLWKINIPSSEKFEVLAHLDSININAFSLFGSEESLMETLALREFHLRERYY